MNNRTKLFHINMLKKYEDRETAAASVAAVSSLQDGAEGEKIPFLHLKQEQTFETSINQLAYLRKIKMVRLLCEECQDIFSDFPGKTDLVECRLELTSTTPVHLRQYPIHFALQQPIEEVRDMLRLDVIERSTSPYNAPLVAVRKPDNTIRLCVDYREFRTEEVLLQIRFHERILANTHGTRML